MSGDTEYHWLLRSGSLHVERRYSNTSFSPRIVFIPTMSCHIWAQIPKSPFPATGMTRAIFITVLCLFILFFNEGKVAFDKFNYHQVGPEKVPQHALCECAMSFAKTADFLD